MLDVTKRQLKRGDKLVIEGISREAFQAQAKEAIQALAARGIAAGSVYHEPIQTGVILIK